MDLPNPINCQPAAQPDRQNKAAQNLDTNIPPHLPLPDLARPPIYTLPATAHLDLVNLDPLHPRSILQPQMTGHTTGIGALLGDELEHGGQEIGDAAALLLLEVVLLAQDVGQGPVAQAVDVAQLALAVEDLLRPLARQAQRLGEGPEQLDDLRDVVVVLAVLCARLGVEKVVAGDELEGLGGRSVSWWVRKRVGEGERRKWGGLRTMAAMLHTSVLAPHLAPRMTSGERYWRVWMSLVKWWLTQQAFPRSAILTLIMSQACMSSALRFSPVVESGDVLLSSEMPETSLVRISAVLSRVFWFSSVLSDPGLGEGSFDLLPAIQPVSERQLPWDINKLAVMQHLAEAV
jgi:hypothetical protein